MNNIEDQIQGHIEEFRVTKRDHKYFNDLFGSQWFHLFVFRFIHGAVIGLSILFTIIGLGSAIKSYSAIDPQKTYIVVDVTDNIGKTHKNLRECTRNTFMDYHGNSYTFSGNFTAITRKVSGEQLLNEIQQPEKNSKPFPIEATY